jgi:hypothetical protein
MTRTLASFSLVCFLSAACTGTIVGGAGGLTGAGAGTSRSEACAGLPDASTLIECHFPVPNFTSPDSCDMTWCDTQSSDQWEASCANGTCDCKRNGVVVCTCSTETPYMCTQKPTCCFDVP